ncbi:MAG: glucose-6-phosphate isomerase [Anaerolineae bacterium]|nr:glucose-6-phosphate isomerase [Anaerolineae bacterium]
MQTINLQANLGDYATAVDTTLAKLAHNNIMSRIWAHDYTVWKPAPTEISNRLGWLTIEPTMREALPRIQQLVEAVQATGYTHALLLGMGGSSLAPEVFRKVFGVAKNHIDLTILDSTVPGVVIDYTQRLDPARTLFIVSTKSGGTVETLSGFKHFYNQVSKTVGQEMTGEHFIAITDPGSSLVSLAERYHFRETFLNDPNIGGRYSALSFFGLVPAALLGLDVNKLLDRASSMAATCCLGAASECNLGAWLGAVLGQMAKMGRDKLTFFTSPEIGSFGDWIEQLIAESTGKEGKGILPIVGETAARPETYGHDRLFVYLRLHGDKSFDELMTSLEEAGHPVITIDMQETYDLGGQFFLWGMAAAVASHCLDINPFDQPDVENAKKLAREIVSNYSQSGTLSVEQPSLVDGNIEVYAPDTMTFQTPVESLNILLREAQEGVYISLQAYLNPTVEVDNALSLLRTHLRDQTGLATTLGYGPRFLHSTGQLHKGDAGRGLFIQITSADPEDLPIPDEAGKNNSSISFGVLKTAQALGDAKALRNAGRQVLRFHFRRNVVQGLEVLREGAVKSA